MKISAQDQLVNPRDEFLLCFDVSKAHLNLYAQYTQDGTTYHLEDEFTTSTTVIEDKLRHCGEIARLAGLNSLRVLCESTGGFEQKLLRTARRLGHQTALINPEHVSTLKTVESNDTGKTDTKDPRVMHLVVRLGKAQRHRLLPPIYQRLRRLNAFYDDEDRTVSTLRTRIMALLLDLFPDYDKSAKWTFDNSGCALMKAYGFNPYRMVRAGYGRFERKMKKHVKWIRFATLEHLFARAEASVHDQRSPDQVQLLERRLGQLWQDLERHQARMIEMRAQIERLGIELQQRGLLPLLDQDVKGISLFNLARIVGETGPLKDFPNKRALLRYAGLNLRERKSGQYKGQTRISKKGRVLLRKILGQTTFPLLRQHHIYGPYYHERLGQGKTELKVKVAVMRKFLVLLYAMHQSGARFDLARFALCQSQYLRATPGPGTAVPAEEAKRGRGRQGQAPAPPAISPCPPAYAPLRTFGADTLPRLPLGCNVVPKKESMIRPG